MQTIPAQLIITRPIETGAAFAKKVQKACGYDVPNILSPGLAVVPVKARLPKSFDHVIFTSANGVAQARRLGITRSVKAWCVGSRTADAARALGFETIVGGGDVAQLFETLVEARPKGKIVHLAGQHTRGDIAGKLSAAGLDCQEITVYDQQVLPPTPELLSAMSGDKPVVIPLFSARSGLILSQMEWRAPAHVIAISPFVADIALEWGADTLSTAERPDEFAMITATCRVLDQLKDGVSVT